MNENKPTVIIKVDLKEGRDKGKIKLRSIKDK
jgi:hypothetical protein